MENMLVRKTGWYSGVKAPQELEEKMNQLGWTWFFMTGPDDIGDMRYLYPLGK